MDNPIEEYLLSNTENNSNLVSKELFSIDDDLDIDFKTDLNDNDIKNIASMSYNDLFLKRLGFKPIFRDYYIKLMRLRVSKNRLSRSEFVNINKMNNTDDTLNKLSDLTNITNSKK